MAGQEGLEPPASGFGDRRSTIGATGLGQPSLPRLLVIRMLVAEPAEFFVFHPVGMQPLILHRIIVAAFAIAASQGNSFSWHNQSLTTTRLQNLLVQNLGDDAGAHGSAALADRKPKLFFHRDRRDQLHRNRHVVTRHHHLNTRR